MFLLLPRKKQLLHDLQSQLTATRGHTLDWLITNGDVDVEELCVAVDQLISDHFVISFALRFMKPGKTTKKRDRKM